LSKVNGAVMKLFYVNVTLLKKSTFKHNMMWQCIFYDIPVITSLPVTTVKWRQSWECQLHVYTDTGNKTRILLGVLVHSATLQKDKWWSMVLKSEHQILNW